MEHRFRRKWFENTIFCIAVVKLACTDPLCLNINLSTIIFRELICFYKQTVEKWDTVFCLFKKNSYLPSFTNIFFLQSFDVAAL